MYKTSQQHKNTSLTPKILRIQRAVGSLRSPYKITIHIYFLNPNPGYRTRPVTRNGLKSYVLNPFVSNAPFLYPLKTSGNLTVF